MNIAQAEINLQKLIAIEKMRNESPKIATKEFAAVPYKFVEIRHKNTTSFIIPSVSSSRRKYLPCGFLDENSIISNSAQAIYNGEIYILGILMSLIHLVWVRPVAGYLKTDYRYSSVLCYNTFPFHQSLPNSKMKLHSRYFVFLKNEKSTAKKL